ncbi:MAG: hypothetical protein K2H79_02075, partial [Bacteroidaceae bacterium]|nr:hypothetical protein [Bacteroidaceae bacterium]
MQHTQSGYILRSLHSGCLAVLLIVLLSACCKPRVPSSFTDSSQLPDKFPDYSGVTVTINIDPLTFTI